MRNSLPNQFLQRNSVKIHSHSVKEIFPSIFIAAQSKHQIGFSMNPAGSDVAFAFATLETNPKGSTSIGRKSANSSPHSLPMQRLEILRRLPLFYVNDTSSRVNETLKSMRHRSRMILHFLLYGWFTLTDFDTDFEQLELNCVVVFTHTWILRR